MYILTTEIALAFKKNLVLMFGLKIIRSHSKTEMSQSKSGCDSTFTFGMNSSLHREYQKNPLKMLLSIRRNSNFLFFFHQLLRTVYKLFQKFSGFTSLLVLKYFVWISVTHTA